MPPGHHQRRARRRRALPAAPPPGAATELLARRHQLVNELVEVSTAIAALDRSGWPDDPRILSILRDVVERHVPSEADPTDVDPHVGTIADAFIEAPIEQQMEVLALGPAPDDDPTDAAQILMAKSTEAEVDWDRVDTDGKRAYRRANVQLTARLAASGTAAVPVGVLTALETAQTLVRAGAPPLLGAASILGVAAGTVGAALVPTIWWAKRHESEMDAATNVGRYRFAVVRLLERRATITEALSTVVRDLHTLADDPVRCLEMPALEQWQSRASRRLIGDALPPAAVAPEGDRKAARSKHDREWEAAACVTAVAMEEHARLRHELQGRGIDPAVVANSVVLFAQQAVEVSEYRQRRGMRPVEMGCTPQHRTVALLTPMATDASAHTTRWVASDAATTLGGHLQDAWASGDHRPTSARTTTKAQGGKGMGID